MYSNCVIVFYRFSLCLCSLRLPVIIKVLSYLILSYLILSRTMKTSDSITFLVARQTIPRNEKWRNRDSPKATVPNRACFRRMCVAASQCASVHQNTKIWVCNFKVVLSSLNTILRRICASASATYSANSGQFYALLKIYTNKLLTRNKRSSVKIQA